MELILNKLSQKEVITHIIYNLKQITINILESLQFLKKEFSKKKMENDIFLFFQKFSLNENLIFNQSMNMFFIDFLRININSIRNFIQYVPNTRYT